MWRQAPKSSSNTPSSAGSGKTNRRSWPRPSQAQGLLSKKYGGLPKQNGFVCSSCSLAGQGLIEWKKMAASGTIRPQQTSLMKGRRGLLWLAGPSLAGWALLGWLQAAESSCGGMTSEKMRWNFSSTKKWFVIGPWFWSSGWQGQLATEVFRVQVLPF